MNPGIMLNSGTFVTREEGVPTVPDVAIALSRLPRFGGHTRRPWSVADHSLFCYRLALDVRTMLPALALRMRLAVLMHDWHEALTGDMPTPFKNEALRAQQNDIDKRLMDVLYPGGWRRFLEWSEEVKYIDREALLAEAHVVGPRPFVAAAKVREHMGDLPSEQAHHTIADGIMQQRFGKSPLDSAEKLASVYYCLVDELYELETAV